VLFEGENILFVPRLFTHVNNARNFFFRSVIGMTIELSRKVAAELN